MLATECTYNSSNKVLWRLHKLFLTASGLGVGKSSHHFFTLSVDVHIPGLEDGGVDM
jgi:hypothetical protein